MSNTPKTPLLATTANELVPVLAEWNEKAFRAKQVIEWIFK